MNGLPLADKVAIVTGAGRGIGRAIALAYATAGAAICCSARTVAQIESTVAEIQAQGGRAIAIPADVTDLAAVEQMVQGAVDHFGQLDILVINAGGNYDKNPVEASNPADWRATIELNLLGAYYCAYAAIPFLKQRGAGKIITVGSGLGHRGRPTRSAYACAKAGLWMLTRVLAQELADDHISVNELIPGPVETDLSPDSVAQVRAFLGETEWLKRPEEVAPLALFLATQPDFGPTAQSFSLMRRDP